MKYFLLVSDLIGFVALCTSAVLASLVLSVARFLVILVLRLINKFWNLIIKLRKEVFSTATKADTRWIVIRLGKFSVLLGKKDVSKPDS